MEDGSQMEGMEQLRSREDSFQKPNRFLKSLPFPESLVTKNADSFLEKVKVELSSAVLLLDIKHGAKFWVQELTR